MEWIDSSFVNISHLASSLLGACVGLVAVIYLALILKRYDQQDMKQLRDGIIFIVSLLLGGGGVDYVIFDKVMATGGWQYYGCGTGLVFLPIGLYIFFDWKRGA